MGGRQGESGGPALSFLRYLWIILTGEGKAEDISATFADQQPGLVLDALYFVLPEGIDLRVDTQYMIEEPASSYYYARPASFLPSGNVQIVKDGGGDCSGGALAVAVDNGLCTAEWANAHRTTSSIFAATTDLGKEWSAARAGDLACFAGHVGLVVLFDEDGCPLMLNWSGGTSITKGDNPNAKAKVQRVDYRKDFTGFRRFPTS